MASSFPGQGRRGLLKDASRPPRRKPLTAEKIAAVVHMTLHTQPPNATHWSVRTMAAAAGLSPSSIQRIWSAHGLKPHLTKTFKQNVSNQVRIIRQRSICVLGTGLPNRATV
jgi:hypothetical protein